MTEQIGVVVPPRTRADRIWDRVRWGLVAGWLAVLVTFPLTAERSASWSDVRALVASGEVTAVRISPELSADGQRNVEVHWKHGLLAYVTEVRQVQGDGFDPGTDDEITATLHSAPSGELIALQPGLTMSRDDGYDPGERVLGFEPPMTLYVAMAVLTLAGLVVLVRGPQPRLATRWAWFWFFGSPIGSALFAFLSGPIPGIRGRREPPWRLTGGWAFLIVAVLSNVTVAFG